MPHMASILLLEFSRHPSKISRSFPVRLLRWYTVNSQTPLQTSACSASCCSHVLHGVLSLSFLNMDHATKKSKVQAEPEQDAGQSALATQPVAASRNCRGPTLANAARSRRHMQFLDLDDLLKGNNGKALATLQDGGARMVRPLPRIIPIAELPGDVVAICLSFLDTRTLLRAAQFVSRAWRDAIGGGLPAVWHDVCVHGDVSDGQMAEIARQSCGNTMSFSASVPAHSLRHLCWFSNLRLLHIELQSISRSSSISVMLSRFPLLEELSVRNFSDVVFPPLIHLKTVQCADCNTPSQPSCTHLSQSSRRFR